MATELQRSRRVLGLPVWAWLVGVVAVLTWIATRSRTSGEQPHDLDTWLS